MPYNKGSMPDRLKGKGIPQSFADIFISTFNSALADSGDEGKAYRIAYSAMAKALRKAGYAKGADGKWHKEADMGSYHVYVDERDFDPDAGGGVDRDKLAPGDFVFPDEKAFPVKIPKDAHEAVRSWGRYRGSKSFAEFKRRLTALCKRKGEAFVKRLPAEWKQKEGWDDMPVTEDAAPIYESLDAPPVKVLEAREDGSMRFEGVALFDNCLSKNRRYYSPEANDRIIENTNRFIAQDVVTIHTRHSRATGSPLMGGDGLPIGKVERLYRDPVRPGQVFYEGEIIDTRDGLDAIKLAHKRVLRPASIRSYDLRGDWVEMEMDGRKQEVWKAEDGLLHGIDFCERPGVTGAGITRIFEEAPIMRPLPEEDNDMEISELTLDMLQSERPDLVTTLQADQAEVFQAKIDDLESQIEALQEQAKPPDPNAELESQVEALQETLLQAQGDLALYEKCATSMVREMVAQARALPADELDANLPEIRQAAIAKALPQGMHSEAGAVRGKRTAQDPDVGDPDYQPQSEREPLPDLSELEGSPKLSADEISELFAFSSHRNRLMP